MKPENNNIGYAHGHLGAISNGMPVYDSNDNEIGVVDAIEFTPDDEAADKAQDEAKSGFIKVRNDNLDEAYYVNSNQINYVNEGVIQLNTTQANLKRL